jgi:hypothetical protein
MFLGVAVLLIFFPTTGCAPTQNQPIQQIVQTPPLFPPQNAMQTGNYAGFFTENSEALKSCQDPDKCAMALFNLCFLYCYAQSPYYNPQLGLKYIEDLLRGAPESVWAYQATVWRDNINKSMKKKAKKHPVHADSKAKEAPVTPGPQMEEPVKAEAAPENDSESDRQAMEERIRAQEEIIDRLSKQLEKSREIDIEIEKKERGLLYNTKPH